MEKNKKKKFRDIRNAIVMMCVMVAMMSTASYAWFTLTDSPTVVGMQMTATSSGGLQVCNTENGTFADAITIADTETKILKPVTPGATVGTFQTGVYAGNTVTGVTALANITDQVAKYEYYLKSTGTGNETLNIGIITGDMTSTRETDMIVDNNVAKIGGSIVRVKKGSTNSEFTPYAIRVGLVPDGSTTMYVWEPNNDGTISGTPTMAVDNSGVTEVVHVSSNMAGTIDGGTIGASSNATISGGLFTMPEGSTLKVTMYIWIEGTDEQCANEIQAGDVEAQIQFTVVDDTVAAP